MDTRLLRCFCGGCRVGGAIGVRCRLKACSTSFPVFFKGVGRTTDMRVLFPAKLLLPLLFLLRKGGLKGGRLSTVEVQGCAFEEGDVLRDENVLDGRTWLCQSSEQSSELTPGLKTNVPGVSYLACRSS